MIKIKKEEYDLIVFYIKENGDFDPQGTNIQYPKGHEDELVHHFSLMLKKYKEIKIVPLEFFYTKIKGEIIKNDKIL